jgi:hypothetical protein
MKKNLYSGLFILIFLISAQYLKAQISIGTSDMASVQDTFRLSSGVINPLLDPTATGAGYNWDFSNLTPIIQRIDSFVSPSSTPGLYPIFFGFSSNLAYKVYTPDSIGPIKPSNAFNFYKNSSSSYKQIGYASTINSAPLPINYDTADIIYKFPLQYTNRDSSRSSYKMNLPSLFYYGHSQSRLNIVDGWGTLKTPFGSFAVLRVKSVIMGRDTFAYNGFPGFAINRPLAIEYKWMGQGSGVPLLQINTSQTLGASTVTSISYQDSARKGVPVLGIPEKNTILLGNVDVYPNPASKEVSLSFSLAKASLVTIEITDLSGKKIRNLSKQCNFSTGIIKQNLEGVQSGTYLLSLFVDKSLIKI